MLSHDADIIKVIKDRTEESETLNVDDDDDD